MKRLLIANRGEIARRIIRTAQAMGIDTVAVYSDADAGALHVREATVAHALGGNASADTYLRIDKLLAAAQATGADAVHPGYGFLSENAAFAQAVVDAGLIWVGPPPAAIRALGSKSSAKQLALAHGVPVLPGYQGEDQRDARFTEEAARIGYPVMVKATAGGGGRGMRLVTAPGQLLAALASARSEARSSFGSDELLIERALLNPRHVEVQVFADAHGHCIHLGERDCSVQRRHQKIIEESPSPAVDAALRARMGQCAVALAQAAGYVGAGTVEFLLDVPAEEAVAAAPGRPKQGPDPSGGSEPHAVGSVGAFFLMEMNTRLQVEHPVTELVTGLDLVAWQIRVARGEALPLAQDQVRFDGHAIEVRLCAEDMDFTPHAGTVQRFVAPEGLRCDHALEGGLVVSPHYDAMLGKLIAHGPTREAACARLHTALAQTVVLGLPTNRAFLQGCLVDPVFAAGQAHIPFLAERGDAIRSAVQANAAPLLAFAAVAVHFAGSQGAARALPLPFAKPLRLRDQEAQHDFTLRETGHGRLVLQQGEHHHQARCQPLQGGEWAVDVDGTTHPVRLAAVGGGRWHVQCAGAEWWLNNATLLSPAGTGGGAAAGELRAPFNGKVIAVSAPAGTAVARGDTVLVIESMKLEHAMPAPRDGVVAEVAVAVGQQVQPGQLLWRYAP